MLRSVGALTFGTLSDRYGRKWPFIFNLCLLIIFELSSGFCNTLPQFLGVRSLYGIAMGGMKTSTHAIFTVADLFLHRVIRPCRRNSTRGLTIRRSGPAVRAFPTSIRHGLSPCSHFLPRGMSPIIPSCPQCHLSTILPILIPPFSSSSSLPRPTAGALSSGLAPGPPSSS